MRVVIKTTKIKLKPETKEFIEKNISSLERFAKDIFKEKFSKGKSKIEAWVEIAKDTKHQKGPYFYAECQMRLPGKSIRAESLKENLKSAIIEIREELERQIKEFKKKLMAKFKRGARRLKRELKISQLAKRKEGKRVLKEGA